MDMEQHTLIGRLARHLATRKPGPWQDRVEEAASLIAILKSPDEAMCKAGDQHVWEKMIDAALRQRWSIAPAAGEPPGGSDEEGDMTLPPEGVSGNRAEWVHLHNEREKPA